MVITLMKYNTTKSKNITVEDLMNIPTIKFVQEYEKCAEYFGFNPVISINSGKGCFDYARALSKLWQDYKQKTN